MTNEKNMQEYYYKMSFAIFDMLIERGTLKASDVYANDEGTEYTDDMKTYVNKLSHGELIKMSDVSILITDQQLTKKTHEIYENAINSGGKHILISPKIKEGLSGKYIEIFDHDFFSMRIQKSKYYCKHTIDNSLDDKLDKNVYSKIFSNDYMIKYIGAKKGDIIKITRPSETSLVDICIRVVI